MKFIFSKQPGEAANSSICAACPSPPRINVLMNTFTATGVRISRRSTGLRIFLGLLAILVLAAISAVVYAYFIARAALPQLDGNLVVKGLSAPVKVTRDTHGVPAIEASSLEDLFFAQGFITAQDRLWQMDVMRRFGAGELSEILGKGTVKIDREQRILGLRASAKKSLAMATPRDRSYFDAYARGVNAFIEAHEKSLPIEFRILKYKPKPWQAEDSIVIANQMVKDLNFYTFKDSLTREKILAKLGPELTADLYVNRSWHDRPPTVMREDINENQQNQGDSNDDDDDDDDESGPDNAVTQRSGALEIWAQRSEERR